MTIDYLQREVEATLLSLDGMSRAEVPPFFYTRLVARLEEQPSPAWWQQVFAVAAKPVFAVVTLSLFLIFNIATISLVLKDKHQVSTTTTAPTIQGFAQEYDFSVSTIYNDKPTNQ